MFSEVVLSLIYIEHIFSHKKKRERNDSTADQIDCLMYIEFG